MKKLLFIIIMTAPVFAYSQKKEGLNLPIKKEPQQYSCRELEVTQDGKTMTLRKDVKIETVNLILRADSAVFNNENQTWLAYGTKELVFNGGTVVAREKPNNTVRYTLGDKFIYLE